MQAAPLSLVDVSTSFREPVPAILRTLGSSPGLEVPDHPEASLPPGKPYAVLCLIALNPTGVSRDDLCVMLWPESPSDRARASARQALHVLRKSLGASAIVETGDSLALTPGSLFVDLEELDEAITTGNLVHAHALWAGGPFANFSLAGSAAFNDWADGIRSRYEQHLGTSLLAEAELARIRGGDEETLEWLDRALDVRPYDEETHVARIDALIELGQVDEAESALHRAHTVVDEPGHGIFEDLRGRLQRVKRSRILDGEPPPDHPTLDFVGRTAELAELRRQLRTALSGRPRNIAFLGPAGVGKTRLAEEFLRTSVPADACVARTKAVDTDRQIELGMIADLIREVVTRPGAAGISNASQAVLQQVVPSLGRGSQDPVVGRPSDASLADAVLDLVEAVAQEGPLILLVDDLQWADTGSRTVLLRVLRSLRALPVLALITCRSGDADLSALRVLNSEGGAGRLTAVELAPLSAAEVGETLTLSVPVYPESELDRVTRRLHAASRGNPLFLVELIRQLETDGVVHRREGGPWVLEAGRLPEDLPLPASVRQILERRLSLLSEEARVLARTLASSLFGMPAADLMAQAPLAAPAATAALGELLNQGIVSWTDADAVAFTHDTLRDAVAALIEDPGASPGRPAHRWPSHAWAALAAVAAVTVVTVGWLAGAGAASRPAPRLYGGGILYSTFRDHVDRVRPPRGPNAPWDSLSPLALPAHVRNVVLATRLGGETSVFGVVTSERGVPMAVKLRNDGRWSVLLPQPGDVTVNGVSPDDRYVLLDAADESGHSWRQRVVRYDLTTGDTATVHAPPAFGSARWFPDGSALVALSSALSDTLILMRPDGRRMSSVTLPGSTGPSVYAPCGGPGHRVVRLDYKPGVLASFQVVDLDSGSTEEVRPALPALSTGLACSPDGKGVAYVADVDGDSRLVIQDIESGDVIPGPSWSGRIGVAWLPPPTSQLPATVHVDRRHLDMHWGEIARVDARVTSATGRVLPDTSVVWASLDPQIAYVTRGGRVFANREGVTRLVASVDDWITDTMEVRVTTGGPPRNALLTDRFEKFDTTVWWTYGHPRPFVVRTGSGFALDMNGDGVGTDGMMSRSSYDLSHGATLELSYRLPLTRRDRQNVSVCLTPSWTAEDLRLRISTVSGICFSQPAGELSSFDSTAYVFSSGTLPIGAVSRPDLFPSDDWKHVAIVLAPDGNARLLIDRKEVARLPLPVRMGNGTRWVVQINGRAADTRLLIRDLVLWEGMRY